MSRTTYGQLVAKGAAKLPDGYFYRVTVGDSREIIHDPVPCIHLSLYEHVTPGRVKGRLFSIFGTMWMADPNIQWQGGETLYLSDNRYGYDDVVAPEDVWRAVAGSLRILWEEHAKAHADELATKAAVAIALTLVGDHP